VTPIRAVISDFGGVLTSPLIGSFAVIQEKSGIPTAALGQAMARIAEREDAHPLFELEKGRMTEPEFMAKVESALCEELGREVSLHGFSDVYFEHLSPNDELIAYMGEVRRRGFRMALLTNNVREWEPLWRAMVPVDDLFEIVVDSAFVGMRKPEREIYELTVDRLGVAPEECVFLDDLDVNCEAARELGMTAVLFETTEGAIAELEAALGGGPPAASG
jgi:putative hydrolase of the HAD superfamily